MEFTSDLAKAVRTRSIRTEFGGKKTYLAVGFIIFIVLTLTSSSSAAPSVVIHTGSNTSMAKYIGDYDRNSNVVRMAVTTPQDWVSLEMQFNGKFSELTSIAFTLFISSTGSDEALEPYVVVKLADGTRLTCDPCDSYGDLWYQPEREWQTRDVSLLGLWSSDLSDGEQTLEPLSAYAGSLGDRQVTGIGVFVGRWTLDSPFDCYVGDFSVNGVLVDFANARRG